MGVVVRCLLLTGGTLDPTLLEVYDDGGGGGLGRGHSGVLASAAVA